RRILIAAPCPAPAVRRDYLDDVEHVVAHAQSEKPFPPALGIDGAPMTLVPAELVSAIRSADIRPAGALLVVAPVKVALLRSSRRHCRRCRRPARSRPG